MKESGFSAATADDLRLLEVDIDTLFVMSATGRIMRENDPERSAGPRVCFFAYPAGNLVRIRYDIDDRIAEKILEVAARQLPWRDLHSMSGYATPIVELLAAQPESISSALIYRLPNHLSYEHSATIVRGDSPDGHALLARLEERGMPDYMRDAGFKSVEDFWQPWCVALEGNEIASMCYAARLGDKGAEVGVFTFPNYRSRGLAAAVTASWTSMPALKARALFYSTRTSNLSSQSVAARLGLRLIGLSFRIG
jgi:hypothetical protein